MIGDPVISGGSGGKGGDQGEILQQSPVTCTQRRGQTLSGLDRIRKAAKQDKHLRFTSLMHHLSVELLRTSYQSLKRDASPGVDGQGWSDYGEQLESRLEGLHKRVQSGSYRAMPSKRIWILKPDGRQRPIGVAAVEDKIVQHAVVQVLNQIYEETFLGFSYGFRPNRDPHKALDAIWVGLQRRKVGWVLDADISGFFDAIDHQWLMKFMAHRIADPRILALIQKWLRAGVSEGGQWTRTRQGTPQGSVISPLLANIYLHYVLDLWVKQWRKRSRGDVIIVRYADDWITGFQHQSEAQSFRQLLQERLAKFGLELHPEKTRLIEFGRFAQANRIKRGKGKPETFDFLGFTHICAQTRKHHRFTIRRRTIAKRQRAKLKVVRKEIIRRRHLSVPAQGKWIRSILQGHLNYFAVPGNQQSVQAFRKELARAWLRALRRRSQKGANMTWDRMNGLFKTWLPTAKIKHLYPNQRLCVT